MTPAPVYVTKVRIIKPMKLLELFIVLEYNENKEKSVKGRKEI